MNYALIGSLVLVLLYNLFFFPPVLGIGMGVTSILNSLYLYLTRNHNSKTVPYAIAFSIVSIVFALFFGIRATFSVLFLNYLSSLVLGLLAMYFYKIETPFTPSIGLLLSAPFFAIEGTLRGLVRFFFRPKNPEESKSNPLGPIIRGIVIALPVLFILLVLLTNADPIFQKLTQNFLNTIAERVIFSVILFLFVLGYGLAVVKERSIKEHKVQSYRATESLIVVSSVCLLLGIFLLIQLRYLFIHVPENELHKLGIAVTTYSEYVRKGFFQLLFASILTTGIVSFVLRFVHELKEKTKLALQILLSFLTIETALLIVSAGRRLSLYMHAHGLTESRIFGVLFLMWLSILLGVLFVHIIQPLKAKLTFFFMLIVTIITISLTTIIPIDRLIATTFPPTVNNQIDYHYLLTTLGPETYPLWKSYIVRADNDFNRLAKKPHRSIEDTDTLYQMNQDLSALNSSRIYLIGKYGSLDEAKAVYRKEPPGPNPPGYVSQFGKESLPKDVLSVRTWRAFNLGEYQAYREMKTHREVFDRLDPLIRAIDALQHNASPTPDTSATPNGS